MFVTIFAQWFNKLSSNIWGIDRAFTPLASPCMSIAPNTARQNEKKLVQGHSIVLQHF